MVATAKRGKGKAKGKRKGRLHANGKAPRSLTRFSQPTDEKVASRIARGLAKFRESAGLSVPLAANKYGIDQTAWYRIERGTHPQTMIQHIDEVAAAIGLDIIKLIQLGT